MRAIVIVSLMAAVIAVVTASVLPQEEVDFDERSAFVDFFKKIGTKIKETFNKIKSAFHKAGSKLKDFGHKIGHFVSKSEKVAGDFFVKEGKKLSHAIVVGEKAIEHDVHDAYDEAKEEFKKIASHIDFHKIILELINMIDTDRTQTACASLAEKAIVKVAGQVAATTVKSFDPLFHTVCKGALHVVEMIATKELKSH